MFVPPRGVGGRFLGNDPEHVRQVVQSVDHLFHISVLNSGYGIGRDHGDCSNSLWPAAVAVVNAIDVVRAGERVPVDRAAKNIEPLTREQIHTGIDACSPERLSPRPQATEISRVELGKVELQPTVGGCPWPRPAPWMRTDYEIRRGTGRAWETAELRQLGVPEQREIVSVGGQELHKGVEIRRLQCPIGAPILKRVPAMRSVQDENRAMGVLEVVRIAGGHERSGNFDAHGLRVC